MQPVFLEKFGEGWDNIAFLVNNQYVFRFPRRELGVECLQNELKVLPFLEKRLPLSIPVIEFVGRETVAYPCCFAGYKKLSGVTACSVSLSDEARIKNAIPLAQFLATLHAIPVEEARAYGATEDTLGRIDPQSRIPLILDNSEKLQKLNLLDVSPIVHYIQNMPEIQKNNKLTLVHGDFYVRHLLLDSDENVTGIIDWGDVELSNPAIDLAIAHSFLPPQAHAIFREAYGAIDDDIWELARIRAIFSALTITLYGHEIGDNNLKREGLWGLRNIMHSLPGESSLFQ